MNVPFVDLKSQYRSIQSEIDSGIREVIESTDFIGGSRISDFEARFAAAQGAEHCVAVGNGTDAIYIALKMLGIGPGDEVITAANSWISTSETITQTGARPVFVDIDQHYNIDISLVESRITARTKAILPVHLYGQPASVDRLKALCQQHGLALVEDCAQAHLAEIDGQKVGSIGAAGTFSFYPGKNLGAYGDAGAILTNDEQLARKCRMYARHGALVKHDHQMEGVNSRMDALQATILSVKLPFLQQWTEARRRVADSYGKLLAGIEELELPLVAPNRSHVYHLYVVRTKRRDELREYLSKNRIQTGIHYPTALPFLPAYSYLGHQASDFPRAYEYQGQILSLPMYAELGQPEIEFVAEKIHRFFG